MDLSAVIFVVLALAWAVYLIPKALTHHDEMASDRLVEGHTDRVRILSRKTRTTVVETTETTQPPASQAGLDPAAPAPQVTRAAARKAAQRRRRVLGVLVVAFAVIWTLTWFAFLPYMTPAIPGALVVGWLVLARLSVRRQQRARRAVVEAATVVGPVETTTHTVVERATVVEPVETATHLVDRLAEDTGSIAREDLEAALADDGSLWDPLPMTLPTYVNKARARRTVRTIELTGINSSGHDQVDTALAREAEESASATEAPESGERKVAGA